MPVLAGSMGRDLVHVLDAWTNTPLACRVDYGQKAAAILSGRLNIASIRTDFEEIGRSEMESLTRLARYEADNDRAARRGIGAMADNADYKRGSIVPCVGDAAVIQVYGALARTWGIGPYSGSTGYDGILLQLEAALDDDDIRGIWVDVRSNGGTIDFMYELMDIIYAARKSSGGPKPIWGFASSFAYSAAYGLLSSCDKCFMPEGGGVGSIGVITMHTSYARQNEMEGIDVTVMRYPELKARGTEDEQLDEDTYKRIMAQLAYYGGLFQMRVARNMRISKRAVVETKGLDYTAPEALAIGLVSDVLPEAEAWENFRREITRRR
jgi:ClpP class serine protease